MNIDKYIGNTIQTDNGCCYKDDNAFNNDFDAICYIPEYSLDELQELREDGEDLTDEELIKDYCVYTRNSIRQAILDYLREYQPKYTLESVVESEIDVSVYDICDWQCPETWLADCELQYQYIAMDINYKPLEIGNKVLYHDSEKEEGNPDLSVVWEIYEIQTPEIICIKSEIGEAKVPPYELELIEEK